MVLSLFPRGPEAGSYSGLWTLMLCPRSWWSPKRPVLYGE